MSTCPSSLSDCFAGPAPELHDHHQGGGRRANSVHRGASQSQSVVVSAGTPWTPGANHQLAAAGARALPNGPGAPTLLDDCARAPGPAGLLFFVGKPAHQGQVRPYPRRRGQEFVFAAAVQNTVAQPFVALHLYLGPVAALDDQVTNRRSVADVEGL